VTDTGVRSDRREGGDAGHIPGCRREHSLDTACVVDAHEAGLARVVAAQDRLVARALDVSIDWIVLGTGRFEGMRGDAPPARRR